MNIFNYMAMATCALVFVLWACLFAVKYVHFGYYDWDTALYSQAMWSLVHGTTQASLFGGSFLTDHAHYIAFLLAPIYSIFPHPLTLLNLELASFVLGAFLIYQIARNSQELWVAFVLMLAYLAHPANIFMLLYEFHFESLSLVCIVALFYFMMNTKYIPFLITAFLLILIKENLALIVMMYGVYGMLTQKDKVKWGLIPFVMGSVFFAVNLFVLIPAFRHGKAHLYWSIYAHLGSSPGAIIKTVLFHPGTLIQMIGTPDNLHYLKQLFGAYGICAWMAPQVLLLELPIFMQNLLSSVSTLHTIYFHYAATIVPCIVLAAIAALAFIRTRFPIFIYRTMAALLAVLSIYNALIYVPQWRGRVDAWVDNRDFIRQRMVEAIPDKASVVASFDFLSHLSNRKGLYAFYEVWRGVDYFNGETPFHLPKDVEFALIDWEDPWLEADLSRQEQPVQERIKRFLLDGHWNIIASEGNIVLYQRKNQ